jgi:hypothetical protein
MTSSELRYTQTSADKLMDKYLSAKGTQTKQEGLALALLSISLLGVITTAMNNVPDAFAQTSSSTGTEKKDIFKVIMTVQGLNNNTADIITIVSVNGESRVKLFDDSKTYINSISAAGEGGIVEYQKLKKYADLKQQGIITEEEFQKLKLNLLSKI